MQTTMSIPSINSTVQQYIPETDLFEKPSFILIHEETWGNLQEK